MEKWILSAFADEYCPDLRGQVDAMGRYGISHIELRFLDGKNVSELTAQEAGEAKRILEDGGIRVSALGSPLGKFHLEESFASHLEVARRIFENANILETNQIRMFSFYPRPGESRAQCRQEVLDKLGILLDMADSCGLTLCHENEGGLYGESPQQCLDLMEAFGGRLKTVFDMGNYTLGGYAPWPEGYEMLKDYIAYFHIKDALTAGAIVPAGLGEAKIKEILHAHSAYTGKPVMLSLEPHLQTFDGLNKLVDAVRFENPYQFPTQQDAFAEAVKCTKALLKNE